MTTGRDVPKPGETLTLSTGITVGIRKVSPHTREAIGRSIPKPKPPMIEQDYGDGKTRMEPNEDDAGYQQALAEWQQAIIRKSQEVIYRLGVVVDIDHDALTARRAVMEEMGLPVAESDHLAYVQHIVVATDEDMQAIVNAVTNKSQPTEEAVEEHLDTFPDRVQGAALQPVAAENGGAQL